MAVELELQTGVFTFTRWVFSHLNLALPQIAHSNAYLSNAREETFPFQIENAGLSIPLIVHQIETKDNSTYSSDSKAQLFQNLFDRYGGGDFEPKVLLTQEAKDFIDSHEDIFPAGNKEGIDTLTETVDPRLVARDFTPYSDTLVQVYGTVLSSESFVFEEDTMTILQVMPEEGGDLWFVYYPSETDILDEDYGYYWVLPVASNAIYETVAGGKSEGVVCIGSFCEKAPSPWE